MRDLNDLYYFAQVVDHGGFAPAGRALGMPKSKLSRRIALLEDRLGVRLEQAFSAALDGQLEFYRVQRQDDLADYETETGGYNMLGASLGYHGSLGQTDYLLYLRGDNLLDAKAREHTSFIKDEVLLPGRNLTVGVRLSF